MTGVLSQANPVNITRALLRVRLPLAREVAESLVQPVPEAESFEFQPGTAGALTVPEFPSVQLERTVAGALANPGSLGESRYEFNRVYVVDENGNLAGQLNIVDIALHLEQTPVRDILTPAPRHGGVKHVRCRVRPLAPSLQRGATTGSDPGQA